MEIDEGLRQSLAPMDRASYMALLEAAPNGQPVVTVEPIEDARPPQVVELEDAD